MRVDEWTFENLDHPVYERGDEEQWPVPLPGLVATPYREDSASGRVTEPLVMQMTNYPSVDLYRTPAGSTIQKVDLRSEYAAEADITPIERLANEWLRNLENMSLGPYSLAMLRNMGHPYGYGTGGPPSWEKLRRPRRMPNIHRARRQPPMRQSVPDASIINYQTGAFWASWDAKVLRWYGGVSILFQNSRYYAWFLAHGTIKMQAHGPWAEVAARMLPGLFEAWRAACYQAWRRRQIEVTDRVAAIDQQFGVGAARALEAQAEAGGFA
jgi:hypothetical protein